MTRVAQCHCGQVKLTCTADPDPVIACHCELCQRRTGSVMHIGAWFNHGEVTFAGSTTAFTRSTGDRGAAVTFNFCPTCGTSIWWAGAQGGPFDGKIGIAGGCFADPDFPPPTISVYEKHRHPWVATPSGIPCLTAMDLGELGPILSGTS